MRKGSASRDAGNAADQALANLNNLTHEFLPFEEIPSKAFDPSTLVVDNEGIIPENQLPLWGMTYPNECFESTKCDGFVCLSHEDIDLNAPGSDIPEHEKAISLPDPMSEAAGLVATISSYLQTHAGASGVGDRAGGGALRQGGAGKAQDTRRAASRKEENLSLPRPSHLAPDLFVVKECIESAWSEGHEVPGSTGGGAAHRRLFREIILPWEDEPLLDEWMALEEDGALPVFLRRSLLSFASVLRVIGTPVVSASLPRGGWLWELIEPLEPIALPHSDSIVSAQPSVASMSHQPMGKGTKAVAGGKPPATESGAASTRKIVPGWNVRLFWAGAWRCVRVMRGALYPVHNDSSMFLFPRSVSPLEQWVEVLWNAWWQVAVAPALQLHLIAGDSSDPLVHAQADARAGDAYDPLLLFLTFTGGLPFQPFQEPPSNDSLRPWSPDAVLSLLPSLTEGNSEGDRIACWLELHAKHSLQWLQNIEREEVVRIRNRRDLGQRMASEGSVPSMKEALMGFREIFAPPGDGHANELVSSRPNSRASAALPLPTGKPGSQSPVRRSSFLQVDPSSDNNQTPIAGSRAPSASDSQRSSSPALTSQSEALVSMLKTSGIRPVFPDTASSVPITEKMREFLSVVPTILHPLLNQSQLPPCLPLPLGHTHSLSHQWTLAKCGSEPLHPSPSEIALSEPQFSNHPQLSPPLPRVSPVLHGLPVEENGFIESILPTGERRILSQHLVPGELYVLAGVRTHRRNKDSDRMDHGDDAVLTEDKDSSNFLSRPSATQSYTVELCQPQPAVGTGNEAGSGKASEQQSSRNSASLKKRRESSANLATSKAQASFLSTPSAYRGVIHSSDDAMEELELLEEPLVLVCGKSVLLETTFPNEDETDDEEQERHQNSNGQPLQQRIVDTLPTTMSNWAAQEAARAFDVTVRSLLLEYIQKGVQFPLAPPAPAPEEQENPNAPYKSYVQSKLSALLGQVPLIASSTLAKYSAFLSPLVSPTQQGDSESSSNTSSQTGNNHAESSNGSPSLGASKSSTAIAPLVPNEQTPLPLSTVDFPTPLMRVAAQVLKEDPLLERSIPPYTLQSRQSQHSVEWATREIWIPYSKLSIYFPQAPFYVFNPWLPLTPPGDSGKMNSPSIVEQSVDIKSLQTASIASIQSHKTAATASSKGGLLPKSPGGILSPSSKSILTLGGASHSMRVEPPAHAPSFHAASGLHVLHRHWRHTMASPSEEVGETGDANGATESAQVIASLSTSVAGAPIPSLTPETECLNLADGGLYSHIRVRTAETSQKKPKGGSATGTAPKPSTKVGGISSSGGGASGAVSAANGTGIGSSVVVSKPDSAETLELLSVSALVGPREDAWGDAESVHLFEQRVLVVVWRDRVQPDIHRALSKGHHPLKAPAEEPRRQDTDIFLDIASDATLTSMLPHLTLPSDTFEVHNHRASSLPAPEAIHLSLPPSQRIASMVLAVPPLPPSTLEQISYYPDQKRPISLPHARVYRIGLTGHTYGLSLMLLPLPPRLSSFPHHPVSNEAFPTTRVLKHVPTAWIARFGAKEDTFPIASASSSRGANAASSSSSATSAMFDTMLNPPTSWIPPSAPASTPIPLAPRLFLHPFLACGPLFRLFPVLAEAPLRAISGVAPAFLPLDNVVEMAAPIDDPAAGTSNSRSGSSGRSGRADSVARTPKGSSSSSSSSSSSRGASRATPRTPSRSNSGAKPAKGSRTPTRTTPLGTPLSSRGGPASWMDAPDTVVPLRKVPAPGALEVPWFRQLLDWNWLVQSNALVCQAIAPATRPVSEKGKKKSTRESSAKAGKTSSSKAGNAPQKQIIMDDKFEESDSLQGPTYQTCFLEKKAFNNPNTTGAEIWLRFETLPHCPTALLQLSWRRGRGPWHILPGLELGPFFLGRDDAPVELRLMANQPWTGESETKVSTPTPQGGPWTLFVFAKPVSDGSTTSQILAQTAFETIQACQHNHSIPYFHFPLPFIGSSLHLQCGNQPPSAEGSAGHTASVYPFPGPPTEPISLSVSEVKNTVVPMNRFQTVASLHEVSLEEFKRNLTPELLSGKANSTVHSLTLTPTPTAFLTPVSILQALITPAATLFPGNPTDMALEELWAEFQSQFLNTMALGVEIFPLHIDLVAIKPISAENQDKEGEINPEQVTPYHPPSTRPFNPKWTALLAQSHLVLQLLNPETSEVIAEVRGKTMATFDSLPMLPLPLGLQPAPVQDPTQTTRGGSQRTTSPRMKGKGPVPNDPFAHLLTAAENLKPAPLPDTLQGVETAATCISQLSLQSKQRSLNMLVAERKALHGACALLSAYLWIPTYLFSEVLRENLVDAIQFRLVTQFPVPVKSKIVNPNEPEVEPEKPVKGSKANAKAQAAESTMIAHPPTECPLQFWMDNRESSLISHWAPTANEEALNAHSRSLLSLHPETLNLLAQDKSNDIAGADQKDASAAESVTAKDARGTPDTGKSTAVKGSTAKAPKAPAPVSSKRSSVSIAKPAAVDPMAELFNRSGTEILATIRDRSRAQYLDTPSDNSGHKFYSFVPMDSSLVAAGNGTSAIRVHRQLSSSLTASQLQDTLLQTMQRTLPPTDYAATTRTDVYSIYPNGDSSPLDENASLTRLPEALSLRETTVRKVLGKHSQENVVSKASSTKIENDSDNLAPLTAEETQPSTRVSTTKTPSRADRALSPAQSPPLEAATAIARSNSLLSHLTTKNSGLLSDNSGARTIRNRLLTNHFEILRERETLKARELVRARMEDAQAAAVKESTK